MKSWIDMPQPVSRRSSMKRKLSAYEDNVTNVKTKLRRSQRMKSARKFGRNKNHFPLLELPAEIRLEILKLLLWQPNPFWSMRLETKRGELKPVFERNHDFWPQILRTCRQLHEEGERFLYENVIQILIWISERGLDEAVLDWEIFCVDMVDTLPSKFRRIHVEYCIVGFDKKRWTKPISEDECIKLRQTLFDLSIGLADIPVEELSFELKRGKRPFSFENPIGERFISPLSVLRGIKSVKFTGISDAYAEELTDLMTGNTPSENKVRLVRSLEDIAGMYGLFYDDLNLEFCEARWDLAEDDFGEESDEIIFDLVREFVETVQAAAQVYVDTNDNLIKFILRKVGKESRRKDMEMLGKMLLSAGLTLCRF